tara:strand:- start:151 stop:456 length:306 start_codon:yes stop_codon:yes gene_type:complete
MEQGVQNHPQYGADRLVVNRLMQSVRPTEDDLTQAGRLFVRYSGFPGAYDLKKDLSDVLITWKMTREQLNSACFKIWNKGFRPGSFTEEITVGSGAGETEQ